MKIMEYRQGCFPQLCKDLTLWNSACIKEEQLPTPLLRAYRELWREDNGSYCFLAKYKDAYGVAIVNQFYDKKKECLNIPDLYGHMVQKADEYATQNQFQNTQIIFSESTGLLNGNEFITFVPWNTPKEIFDQIDNALASVYVLERARDIESELHTDDLEEDVRG